MKVDQAMGPVLGQAVAVVDFTPNPYDRYYRFINNIYILFIYLTSEGSGAPEIFLSSGSVTLSSMFSSQPSVLPRSPTSLRLLTPLPSTSGKHSVLQSISSTHATT